MANNLKVILFEDAARTRADLLGALEKHLKPDGQVIPFEAKHFQETEADNQRTYEDRLETILKMEPCDGGTLVVADQDLPKAWIPVSEDCLPMQSWKQQRDWPYRSAPTHGSRD